jgi:type VI secretion system protein ImpC
MHSPIYQSLCDAAKIAPLMEKTVVNLDDYSQRGLLADSSASERLTVSLHALMDCLVHEAVPNEVHFDKSLIDLLISQLDQKLSDQLDEILHHPEFQSLESLWRSLAYLVQEADPRSGTKVELLDVSKDDLLMDFEESPDSTHSGLYHHVYTQEYDTPGGEPFSALVADYFFDKTPQDISLLKEISRVCASAHCPFIGNVDANFFDKDDFESVMKIKDLSSYFERAEFIRWQSFRKTDDSRYIGLALPRFLLRLPYGDETSRVRSFGYNERVVAEDHKKYLWGAGSFAFAANMARSFKKHGWTLNIRGPESGGKVEDLPMHQYDAGLGMQTKIPTEVSIPETREIAFAELGFIPLSYYKNSDFACFFSANSVQLPASYDDDQSQANSRINSRLPYVLLISRLAHYLKVLQRENIGSQKSREHLEGELNQWLSRWVTRKSSPSADTIAKYPLSAASVAVHNVPENPGYYRVQLNVVPHFQVEGMDITLSLISQLPTKK